MLKLKKVLSAHKGEHNLYLHLNINQKEKVSIKSKTMKVDFSDSLISEIENLLGQKSVQLSEKSE